MTKLENKMNWYKEALIKLTDILTELSENTEKYYTAYNKYKQLKEVYEKEAMELKNKGELKTLKDVEIYTLWKVSGIKTEVAGLEATLKVLQIEREKQKYLLEFEKTTLLLERSLEKEDQYIPDNFNS